jgi:gliding motility-associated-like protein
VGVTEDTDVTGSTLTLYRYGDGSDWTELTTHEYMEPGVYTLEQLVNNDFIPGSKLSSREITVVAGEVPVFEYFLCNNRQIFLNVPDDTYPGYFLNFGDGTTLNTAPNETVSHTYANNTPKVVSVTGLINNTRTAGHAANNDCGIAKRTIIPLDNLPVPVINQVNILEPGKIELRYNIIENLQYQLEMSVNGNSGFTELGIPSSSGSFIATGLDTKSNFYCFRLVVKDPCTITTPDIYSNTICSATIAVTAENNQNRISWNSEATNVQTLELFKGNTLLTILGVNQSPYFDTDIICNEEYCYRIKVNYNLGFSTTESLCITATTQNIPPAIDNAAVNVYDKDIHIEWTEPAFSVKEYSIEKSNEDGSYEILGSIENNLYIDKDVDITRSYHCYRILFEDECGNIAPVSRAFCPVLLTVSETEELHYNLTWTHYTGWEEGVSGYIIEKFDVEGNVFESININPATNTYIDDNIQDNRQIIMYRITAVSNNSANWKSQSNLVRMEQKVKVFLPSAFTPNSDNLNDIFIAKGTFIKDLQMKIFNRWGELLFSSDDKTVGWDGNFRGQPAQEGSYVYSLQVTDFNDKTISLKGAFMLIRK